MADRADGRVSLAGRGALFATAVGASASGACVVNIGGVQVTARVATGLSVAAGQALLVLRQGSAYVVIALLPAPPAVPATPDPVYSPPPTGDPAPPPKTATTAGFLTCPPISTTTWRDGAWRTDIGPLNYTDTYQGEYHGSTHTLSHGFAFYGTAPHSLAGSVCTGAVLYARRLVSGDPSAQTPTLRLATETSRPTGYPTINETTAGPTLAVGQTTTSFALPTSWGQALIDGTRGGIGIVPVTENPYIRLAGRGSWSAAWTLVIYWRRG